MVFIAKGRDRQVHARCTVRARLGLGVFDCPACVAILLAQLGWLCRPCRRNRPCLMSRFSLSVLRCFGAATIEASIIWPLIARNPAVVSAASKRSNRPRSPAGRRSGPASGFAKSPDRVGVRHRIGKSQPEKTHKRQPVPDQIFGPLIRQIVAGLQKSIATPGTLVFVKRISKRSFAVSKRGTARIKPVRTAQIIPHSAVLASPLFRKTCIRFRRASFSAQPACAAAAAQRIRRAKIRSCSIRAGF